MPKKKIEKKYLKLISQIENIRKKNNGNWMDLLKVAFKYSPRETARVMSNIYLDDKKISNLVKKLTR